MTLWTGDGPLILASTSRTRRDLLAGAGLCPEIVPPQVDERALEEDAAGPSEPAALALRLATEKALAVSRRRPDGWVIGADQVLDLAGTVLHKPADRAGAAAHLARLAGRSHTLRSAVALARDGRVEDSFVESAVLTMRPLGDDAIQRYLKAVGDAALTGAGAYQVEGFGIHLMERIAGDHATILGLPLIPLLAALRRRGCLAF